MDQVAMVNEHLEGGRRLIDALVVEGLNVSIAFWAKPSDEAKWYLYLASPFVDERGAKAAYILVNETLRNTSDLWIDPLDVKVVGVDDSLAKSALSACPSYSSSSFSSSKSSKFFPGITRIGPTTLGGMSVDGAYFYPPQQPVAQV